MINDARFNEANNEMVIAMNLQGKYRPVVDASNFLSDSWRKWDHAIQDGIYQVREASSRREFKRSLDIAKKLRAEMKIGVYEDDLKQAENWAQMWETRKEEKRHFLKSGEIKFQQYDYADALKDFEIGFADFNNIWAMSDAEPNYYFKIRDEAINRNKRINDLMLGIKRTAEDLNAPVNVVENCIKSADEVLTLQPVNADAKRYREILAARLKSSNTTAESDTLVKQGIDLHTQKKYNEAINAFTKAIALNPDLNDAYRRRAMSKREIKDYKGAIADFTCAIELNSQDSRNYSGRGFAKELSGDLKGALSDYDRAIQIDPKNENGYLFKGNLKYDQKDYSGALAEYERAVAANAKSSKARDSRGLAKEKLGDTNGALQDYEKAVSLDPNNEAAKRKYERLKANLTIAKTTDNAKDDSKDTNTEETVKPSGTEKEILDSGNLDGVKNSPTQPAIFTINQSHFITMIQTYHWNYGRGAKGGNIGLRDNNGKTFGPWGVTTKPGSGNAPNVHWICTPNIAIPAGTYTVIDSDSATWSQNEKSNGRGFALVLGYPAANKQTTSVTTSGNTITALFENKSSQNVHIFTEGETFDPANRLAPGESCKVNVKMAQDGRIKFYAGRNGQVITSKIWNGDPDHLDRYPKVIFNQSDQIIITTGLR